MGDSQKDNNKIETRTARVFNDGANQVVKLPVHFRFNDDELFATRDDATGDVVLPNQPGAEAWRDFFELLHATDAPPTLWRNAR